MSAMNPLLSLNALPLFNQINIELHAFSAMRNLIDNQNASIDKFLVDLENKVNVNVEINYCDVFDKMDEIEHPLSYASGIIYHLASVDDSEKIREVKEKYREEIIELNKKTSQSKTIYNAIKKINTNDENELRVIDISLKGMEKGGVNLEETEKNKLKEVHMDLSKKSTTFSENLIDAMKAYKYVINSESNNGNIDFMKKVPLWVREMWNKEEPETGPWTITLGRPSISAALRFIHNQEIRKTLYLKYISMAGDENEPLINEMLDLRYQESQILGFTNYAELSLSFKMAPNIETILNLLDDLKKVALPKAKEEYEEICKYAEKNNEISEPWDIAFWSERLKEKKFNMKEEELKPYFSLENVLKELFHLSNDIFGITITQQTCVETWHEDVRFYDVFENGNLVAGFYLDPYVREETKKSGAWMNSCVDKNKALKHDVPIAYLICNGTPPSKDKPSLMSFSDVETLFHEYGHGLQHMLTKIDNGEISGINSIEWDAVELPSQFMENWCYNKKTLDRMALHYETGEKLPQNMYESLVLQKNYGAGMATMRQISFSKIDLHLYNNWKTMQENDESIWDIQNKYFQECTPYKTILPEDKFLASFSHIFSGYAAGYYSYKWAEIMSADCFEAFEENMENYKEKGLEFRNSILALGGSKTAMDVFKMFRGREPKVDALLKHNQLQ